MLNYLKNGMIMGLAIVIVNIILKKILKKDYL